MLSQLAPAVSPASTATAPREPFAIISFSILQRLHESCSRAEIVDAAAAAAVQTGSRVVLNNGPWVSLAPRTLAAADPLVVNEHEAIGGWKT